MLSEPRQPQSVSAALMITALCRKSLLSSPRRWIIGCTSTGDRLLLLLLLCGAAILLTRSKQGGAAPGAPPTPCSGRVARSSSEK